MLKLNMKDIKKLSISVLLGGFIGILLCLSGSLTYAYYMPHSPDVVVSIDKKGQINYTGKMFDNSLWYPGKEADGIIRIKNEFKRITVTDLAVQLKLLKWKEGYNRDFVEDSFLQHMKFSVTKDNVLFQNRSLIRNQSLSDFLYREGYESYQGCHLDNEGQFIVDKGGFVDLKYYMVMDWESGNELQDMMVNLDVSITVAEK